MMGGLLARTSLDESSPLQEEIDIGKSEGFKGVLCLLCKKKTFMYIVIVLGDSFIYNVIVLVESPPRLCD